MQNHCVVVYDALVMLFLLFCFLFFQIVARGWIRTIGYGMAQA